MAIHMVAVGKLKLLAGGHGNWRLLAALLGSFAVRLPLAATGLPSAGADLRLFLFRLRRILFGADATASADAALGGGHRRWQRALRLLRERAAGADRQLLTLGANEEMLTAVAMFGI